MGKDSIMPSLSHKNVTSWLGRLPCGTGWCVSVTVGLHPRVISLLCINFKGRDEIKGRGTESCQIP
mgnify:CR=1 FL=1